MEAYSHGPFEISGYRITIKNPENERAIIMEAWKHFFTEDISARIIDREYPSVHAVYYNYHDQDDMAKK